MHDKITLDDTFGALLLGTFFSLLLSGINLGQTYHYFRSFPSDGKYMKATVLIVFVSSSISSVFYMHMSYYYLVASYSHPERLSRTEWSFRAMTPPIIVTIFSTQCFYARRIYIMGSSTMRRLLIPTGMIALSAVAFGIVTTFVTLRYSLFEEWVPHVWLSSASFALASITDILLTSMMVAILRRRRPAFKNTETVLNILVIYTINTGLMTTILELASFVMALIRREDMIFIAINMSITHTYATSMLAVLNSRQALAATLNATPHFDTFHMAVIQPERDTSSIRFQVWATRPRPLSASIHRRMVL
ncbi:hypothetical protein C8Q74DRAFT_581456 [Fomes fomentarius]|nr:hypothetical protein C8Q74DRAFT_581456 [Fomes fomentarius]